MLIQPFVENSIKHGFKGDLRNPKVEIRIIDNQDTLHCIITDNGIGRKKNDRPESKDHTPAGVAMVMDKAEALKHYFNYNVYIEIIDLYTDDKKPGGTVVFISLPKQTSVA
jgi:LytS/YehU family sensor histidine kinase